MIVAGLDGLPASGRRLRDPCAVETERDPAPAAVFVVPPLASRRGMPPVTQHNGSRTSHPCRIGGSGWFPPHRRSTTDLLRFGNRRAPGREDPRSCSRITEPHPRTVSLAGVAALADHLDLLPRRHLDS